MLRSTARSGPDADGEVRYLPSAGAKRKVGRRVDIGCYECPIAPGMAVIVRWGRADCCAIEIMIEYSPLKGRENERKDESSRFGHQADI